MFLRTMRGVSPWWCGCISDMGQGQFDNFKENQWTFGSPGTLEMMRYWRWRLSSPPSGMRLSPPGMWVTLRSNCCNTSYCHTLGWGGQHDWGGDCCSQRLEAGPGRLRGETSHQVMIELNVLHWGVFYVNIFQIRKTGGVGNGTKMEKTFAISFQRFRQVSIYSLFNNNKSSILWIELD